MARLALVLLVLGLSSLPAQAALTLCNRTSYILYAATSAIRSPQSQTEGWTRIAPGDCQIARKEQLNAETYLVHARTSIAHSGPPRAWGGAYPVCVKDGNFTIQQAVTAPYCGTGDTFPLPFAALDNRGKANWTMNFDEQPAMSLTGAQLAGVKRLLKDNGYPIAQIDAKPDKATGAALADFRKRMHFAPDAGNAELFGALEQEARKKTAPAGYTVCNEGARPCWWRWARWTKAVRPRKAGGRSNPAPAPRPSPRRSTATRSISWPSASRAARWPADRNASAPLWRRSRFCGNANCAARGFTDSGFAATRTKGLSGYVAHIGLAGLIH